MYEYIIILGGEEVCPHFDENLGRIMFTAPNENGEYPHEIHTDDWNFITKAEAVTIADTSVKSVYVGSESLIQGELDMTGIYGELFFKMREGTLSFISQQKHNLDIADKFVPLLSGAEVKIISAEDPLYYYEGRITRAYKQLDPYWTSFSMDYKLYPFKKRTYTSLNLYANPDFVERNPIYVEGMETPIYRPLWDLIDFEIDNVIPTNSDVGIWANGALGTYDATPTLPPYAIITNNSDFTIVPTVAVTPGVDWSNLTPFNPDTGYLLVNKGSMQKGIRGADVALTFTDIKPSAYDAKYADRDHTYSSNGFFYKKYPAWMLAIPPHTTQKICMLKRHQNGVTTTNSVGVFMYVRQVQI